MKSAKRQLRARADSESDEEAPQVVVKTKGVAAGGSAALVKPGATAKPKHLFDGDGDGDDDDRPFVRPGAGALAAAGAGAKRPRSAMEAATSAQLGPRKLARADVPLSKRDASADAATAAAAASSSSEPSTASEYSAERLAQLRASQAYKFTSTADKDRAAAAAASASSVTADANATSSRISGSSASLPSLSSSGSGGVDDSLGGGSEAAAEAEMARRAALAKAHREAMRTGGGGIGASAKFKRSAFGVGSGDSGAGPDDSDGDIDDGEDAYVIRGGGKATRITSRLQDGGDNDEGEADGSFIPLSSTGGKNRRDAKPSAAAAASSSSSSSSVPAALRQLATTAPTVALATGPGARALGLAVGDSGDVSGTGGGEKLSSWEKAQLKRAAPSASAAASASSMLDSGLLAKPRAGLSVEEATYGASGAGGTVANAAALGRNGGGDGSAVALTAPSPHGIVNTGSSPAPGTPSFAPVPSLPDPAGTVDRLVGSLHRAAGRARGQAESEGREAARVAAEASQATASLPGLKDSLTSSSAAFDLYQGLRLYLSDFVPCMREKGQLVEEWEAAEAAHCASAATACAAARRRSLMSDVASVQAGGFFLVSVAGSQPPEGFKAADSGDDNSVARDASRRLRYAAITSLAQQTLTSGGTVIGPSHLQQLEQWDPAAAVLSSCSPSKDQLADGIDNSVHSSSDFSTASSRLRSAASLLLADVHDSYASVTSALGRMTSWRGHSLTSLARSYVEAYAYLSLPGLLEPLVRAQLATQWRPLLLPGEGGRSATGASNGGSISNEAAAAAALEAADPSLDPSRMEWLAGAMHYGDAARQQVERLAGANGVSKQGQAAVAAAAIDASTLAEAMAADESLLPKLVATCALPRLARLLGANSSSSGGGGAVVGGGAWDPLGSAASNAAAVAAVKEVLLFEPPPEALQQLLGAVAGGLTSAVTEAGCVPVLTSSTLPSAVRLHASSLWHWLGCLRLLHNIVAWDGVLSPALLRRIALGQLTGPVLLPLCQWALSAAGSLSNGNSQHSNTADGDAIILALQREAVNFAGGLLASVVAALPSELLSVVAASLKNGGAGLAISDLQRLASEALRLSSAAADVGRAGFDPTWKAALSALQTQ